MKKTKNTNRKLKNKKNKKKLSLINYKLDPISLI